MVATKLVQGTGNGSYFIPAATPGQKLRAQAAVAQTSNLLLNGVMASPPTIASSLSTDATLTVSYQTYSGGIINTDKFLSIGGTPVDYGPGNFALRSATVGAGGNVGATNLQHQVSHEIVTDAPAIEFQIFPQNTSHVRFAVSENGGPMQYCGTGTTALASSTSSSYTKLTFSGSAQRRIRMEIGITAGDAGTPGAVFKGFRVAPTYTIWKPQDANQILAAWVSDSYCGTIGNLTWAHNAPNIAASHLLGWQPTSVAAGGTGYTNANGSLGAVSTRIIDLSAQSFDVIVFALGYNDTGNQALQDAALAAFQSARLARPNAPIFVFSSWSAPNTAKATTAAKDVYIQNAFSAFADANSVYIPIYGDTSGDWMPGTTGSGAPGASDVSGRYIGADLVHPNDAGARYLGERMAIKIKQALQTLP